MMVAHQDKPARRGGVSSLDDDDPRVVIDAAPENPGASPLDFIYAEHLRQRQFAKLLHLIADDVINRKTIIEAIRFLEVDIHQHVLDEETAFFPLLRPLCEDDDNIDSLLTLLADEHREDRHASKHVVRILRDIASGKEPSDRDSEALRNFADHLRHHLALENGVLLPLARARMTPQSLRSLGQSILARRTEVMS